MEKFSFDLFDTLSPRFGEFLLTFRVGPAHGMPVIVVLLGNAPWAIPVLLSIPFIVILKIIWHGSPIIRPLYLKR